MHEPTPGHVQQGRYVEAARQGGARDVRRVQDHPVQPSLDLRHVRPLRVPRLSSVPARRPCQGQRGGRE